MVPEDCELQLVPPFVVARMAPAFPTAQPCVASATLTLLSHCVVPDVCPVQVAPPFVVARTAPRYPTAQPRLASLKSSA